MKKNGPPYITKELRPFVDAINWVLDRKLRELPFVPLYIIVFLVVAFISTMLLGSLRPAKYKTRR